MPWSTCSSSSDDNAYSLVSSNIGKHKPQVRSPHKPSSSMTPRIAPPAAVRREPIHAAAPPAAVRREPIHAAAPPAAVRREPMTFLLPSATGKPEKLSSDVHDAAMVREVAFKHIDTMSNSSEVVGPIMVDNVVDPTFHLYNRGNTGLKPNDCIVGYTRDNPGFFRGVEFTLENGTLPDGRRSWICPSTNKLRPFPSKREVQFKYDMDAVPAYITDWAWEVEPQFPGADWGRTVRKIKDLLMSESKLIA